MAELAAFKKRRATNKARLTNIIKYINSANDETSIEDLRTRHARVEELMQEFTTIEHNIFLLDPNEDSDFIYEENYYEAISKLNTWIRAKELASGSTVQDGSFNVSHAGAHHDIKLPKINISPFSGDYTEWQSFYDLFSSTIHDSGNLSPVQKFQYLKGLLRGEAASLLKHISITEANYLGALNKLKERYDRKRHIINSFVRTFIEQPSISVATASNVKQLMDTSDQVIRGLKALGENAETRDHWLIFLLVQKLDEKSKILWAEHITDKDTPQFSDFLVFLTRRIDTLESANMSVKQPFVKPKLKSHLVTGEFSYTCAICNEKDHSLFTCKQFNEMDVTQRMNWAKSGNRCFNCLSSRHQINNCHSRRRCQLCNKKHHTLLHSLPVKESTPDPSHSSAEKQSLTSLCTQHSVEQSILPTALIKVLDFAGSTHWCRALLDSGSQATFITEACVQRLGLRKKNARFSIGGLGSTNIVNTKGLVTVTVQPNRHDEFTMEALILSKITSNVPRQNLKLTQFSYWPAVELADPHFYKSDRIDILIGADYFFNLLETEQIKSATDGTILQKTIFGWVIAGKTTNQVEPNIVSMVAINHQIDMNLDHTLRKFWEIETITSAKQILSPEETFSEEHFNDNVKISNSGRFIVRLPFKKSPQILGKSLNTAIQRLRGIERRFSRDPEFFNLYREFMSEYIRLHHMEEIQHSQATDTGYYLPHHGVIKHSSATTKLRVVFDGSAKTTSGVSLNDCLAIGPSVQSTLFAIILRFREHKYVITGDVEKMYRQVKIHKDDTDFQKIVWRNHPSEPIRHFRLTTITYGLSSAPFLATRVLKRIADDHQASDPVAADAIRNDIYVDDLMTGSNTEHEVKQIKNTICKLLSQHGFHLRKWMSNSSNILDSETIDDSSGTIKPIEESHQDFPQSVKVLGLNWNPATDQFTFSSDLPNITIFTKRIVVSEASRLFDPLGWLAPVIVTIKIFIQNLWAVNLDWDEPLPNGPSNKWQKIRNQLQFVKMISIPRFIQATPSDTVHLHGFSDASQSAYGAVVYLRVHTLAGDVLVNIISAKTKVAPIKQVTLPRLELCAAVLLTKLINTVQSTTQLKPSQIFAWTDSQIVLDWLASHPRRWSTFIGNRTAEILTTLSRNQWHHVSSSDNPADCASRGLLPQELHHHGLWWNGPDWLHKSIECWPSQQSNYGFIEEENRKVFSFNATIDTTWMDELISRYSSLTKLQRVLAFVLRFRSNLRLKTGSRLSGTHLMREELFNAMFKLCYHEQMKFYGNEKRQLEVNKEVNKTSSLKPLNPFIDSDSLIRVGGRLTNSEASFSTKHPIILPSKSHLTTLILRDIHNNNKHAGPSLTLAISKQTYWIPNGRNTVRQVISQCIMCARFKAQVNFQLMGNLPSYRVELVRPFLKIGVDYAGPIPIHLRKGRGQKTYKAYICLFICLGTKAIHMELVCDMTSEAFLAALKRFVSRRGICREIYSDNGTNFIGANNQLKQNFNKLIKESNLISDYSSRQYISWHFIPPNSPHFGGIWEAGIKSAKFHIKRVIGNTVLTVEEMGTLLAEVESVLNSRPLCALHSTDIDVLTPSHFLIGHASTKIPEVDITDVNPSYLTRWRVVQQLAQHFWKRWHIEYLTSLQPRSKWRDKQTSVKVGDIVVIKENNTSVNHWPLGMVVKVHPGSDNIIRVVTLKTKTGEIKRPTNKLCILPISRNEDATLHEDEPTIQTSSQPNNHHQVTASVNAAKY